MGRTLYLDCSSGLSGDMLVAALLDLGAGEKRLEAALASLGVDGFEVRVTRREVSGFAACDFDVVLDHAHENHDHDMDYLYGEGHEHGHGHGYGHHHHDHRGLADVTAIIEAGGLSDRARATALRTFGILAEGEAAAHGTDVDHVHFHEVGAVDSIVDVVAAAWCLDDLDVTDVILSPLVEGEGTVRCAHGVLPVPVPAVANIVAAHGLVLSQRGMSGEFVTPTGAALAAAIRTRDELPRAYRVTGIGVGAGKRAYDPPSTVRAMFVEEVGEPRHFSPFEPDLWKLECEVDDCTGEALGHVMGRLMDAGANEVHYVPVTMKKGRPGWQIQVLTSASLVPTLEAALFADTTTIGVRRVPVWRTCLPREAVEVDCEFGTIAAKRVTLPTGEVRTYPEYESVAAASRASGASYQRVFSAAVAAIHALG